MLFFVKLNPEISSWVLEAAKAALILPLFFLAAKKMTNIAVVLCRVLSCRVVSCLALLCRIVSVRLWLPLVLWTQSQYARRDELGQMPSKIKTPCNKREEEKHPKWCLNESYVRLKTSQSNDPGLVSLMEWNLLRPKISREGMEGIIYRFRPA